MSCSDIYRASREEAEITLVREKNAKRESEQGKGEREIKKKKSRYRDPLDSDGELCCVVLNLDGRSTLPKSHSPWPPETGQMLAGH